MCQNITLLTFGTLVSIHVGYKMLYIYTPLETLIKLAYFVNFDTVSM